MRFNERITFIKRKKGGYNPETGKHEFPVPIPTEMPCNLSVLSTERTTQIFGAIDKVVTVARLQRPFLEDFDAVVIDEHVYKVLRKSNYRKGVLFLERGR